MNVDIIPSLREVAPQKIYGKTAIVLDVFRSTSTIVTAMANGCKGIIPVVSPEDAMELWPKYPKDTCLTSGELKGEKLPGFILGNSPSEFSGEEIQGKTIIMSTTNGTKTIKCCKPAKYTLIGSFLNVTAVCNCASSYKQDIIIICAGSRGNIALEDVLAAGLHIKVLKEACHEIILGEMAKTFYYLYIYFEDHLTQILSTSRSATNLIELGLGNDITYCLQQDIFKIVPVYRQNIIKLNHAIN